jgi:hypothetical protein
MSLALPTYPPVRIVDAVGSQFRIYRQTEEQRRKRRERQRKLYRDHNYLEFKLAWSRANREKRDQKAYRQSEHGKAARAAQHQRYYERYRKERKVRERDRRLTRKAKEQAAFELALELGLFSNGVQHEP